MWRLGRRLHVSWLIAIACFVIVAAVFVGQFLPVRLYNSAWPIIGLLLILPVLVMGRTKLLVVLIIGAGLIGLWRGSIDLAVRDDYKQLIGSSVTITALINEDPSIKPDNLALSLVVIWMDEQEMRGLIYATIAKNRMVKRGETITIKGKLGEGFGIYSATMYRPTVIDSSLAKDPILGARDWFAERVRRSIAEPAASLGLGFLVGEKSQLPSDLVDALQIAGLTHVVVASGYNLTILVRLGRRLFMRVSKFSATLVALLMILCFIGVTGLSPSMTRAGAVALLSLAAWYYGRRFHPFVLLSVVAAGSVWMQPEFVWHDVGWGLSFSAFIGVMIGAPLLQRYFFGQKKPGMVRQILGETVAAHILTLPLIILVFSQVSHVAIISNMLVLPFVPLAMLLTFIVGLLSVVWPWFAEMVGWMTQQLIDYMIAVVYYAADLSWAKSEVSLSVWWVVGMYAVIGGVLLYLWYRTRLDLREANLVE